MGKKIDRTEMEAARNAAQADRWAALSPAQKEAEIKNAIGEKERGDE
jgi:hypothetical protein